MTVQIDLSVAVGLLVSIVGAFWALAKIMLAQNQRHIDDKFNGIAETLSKQDDGSRRIERELMDLKAELPRDYVRREDNNRVIGGLNASIDNLRLTIERALLMRQP